MSRSDPRDERVLVLMPTVRDGQRVFAALASAGITCTVCRDLAELCREMAAGAGSALLTEEALAGDREGLLSATLRSQPAWSDFPLVLLAREGATGRPEACRESMNVSLIERPIRVRSLLSVLRAALRSRRHQYEVRDQLVERERQAAALRDNEERLQFALNAGGLGSWEVDLATGRMECSARCKENFGRSPDQACSYLDLLETVHPDDRERVRQTLARAIEEREGCDLEHRVIWPDGTTRWVMVRGRAMYREDGTPLRMSGVSLDVTDRRRTEEALRDADRKKDDFIALLAHELRNPLAPIHNGLQLLRRSDDRRIREHGQQMMERQLGHMVRLIDDLLDISRINRNKMELRLDRLSLAEVVDSAVETARPVIEAAGQELEIRLPSEPVFLDADLTRLAQVFANLLTNSAKYTRRGGHIRLSASLEGDQVAVAVQDDGIGIPPEAIGSIFDMFAQVDRSLERSTGGLGIGLALVRGLVEMHGGSASAASDGLHRGSTFTVRLPVAGDPPVEPISPETDPPDGRAFGSGLRILVVDDNRDAAESMADMLRLSGNHVIVAHNGAEAVQRAGAFRPELILMDVGMPRLNGLDATRQIRERPWGREMSIIALTGWGQDSDRIRSREAGCDGHLVKPASMADLNRVLHGIRGEGA